MAQVERGKLATEVADEAEERASTHARTLGEVLSSRHLPALDGLRAVAVLVVVFYHAGVAGVPGDLGVSGFFVLSGFLITWLLLRENDATGKISLRNFYMRRSLRIFPAYYVFITASLVLDTILGDPWMHGLRAAAYGYFVNYFNALHGHPTTSIAHAWSLAIEEQFYLLWPAAFLLLRRGGRRMVRRGLLFAIGVVMVWRTYLFVVRGVGPAYVYNAFDTRFDNLAVGCLLAVVIDTDWFSRLASRLVSRIWLPALTLTALYCSRVAFSPSYHYGPGFTVDAVLVAIFIVQMLMLSGTWLWGWLDHPVTRYIGRISYPMYLYHPWALDAARHLGLNSGWLTLVFGVGLTVMAASGSYFMIEKPFLRLKKKFTPLLGRRQTAYA